MGHMLHKKGYLFLYVIFSRTISITLTNPICICKRRVTEEKRGFKPLCTKLNVNLVCTIKINILVIISFYSLRGKRIILVLLNSGWKRYLRIKKKKKDLRFLWITIVPAVALVSETYVDVALGTVGTVCWLLCFSVLQARLV